MTLTSNHYWKGQSKCINYRSDFSSPFFFLIVANLCIFDSNLWFSCCFSHPPSASHFYPQGKESFLAPISRLFQFSISNTAFCSLNGVNGWVSFINCWEYEDWIRNMKTCSFLPSNNSQLFYSILLQKDPLELLLCIPWFICKCLVNNNNNWIASWLILDFVKGSTNG